MAEEKKIRPEKQAITEEVRGVMEDSAFLLMVDYRGLSVEQMGALRDELGKVDSRMIVTKNAFIIHAARALDWDTVQGDSLQGPTAVITGAGDVTQAAKCVTDFARQNERPAFKGGWLGQQVLSADDVEAMAKIPPREILLGKAVGTIAAPLSQFVGVLQQKLASVLYVLKAIEEKKAA